MGFKMLTEGVHSRGDLYEMYRDALAKELAPWAGYGDKFLKALRLVYVLGTEHALLSNSCENGHGR